MVRFFNFTSCLVTHNLSKGLALGGENLPLDITTTGHYLLHLGQGVRRMHDLIFFNKQAQGSAYFIDKE
jgi:hypothetical protein